MKKRISLILAALCLFSSGAFADTSTQFNPKKPLSSIAPYPKPEAGFRRHVIYLPPLKNEDNAKVELIMGKMMQIDCNRHMLGGTLESRTLEGWGFNYYVLTDVTAPMSTMMACADNKKTEQFVTINTIGELRRYNSRLPIVVFAPTDIDVKYRIWNAASKISKAIEK